MSNTEIWDKLKRPPAEQLKAFTRAGGFKGTAVRPMWTIHKMTELFGPCGQGWGINEPSFQVVPAGDEILVFCTVAIWHGNSTQTVFGVGGDKVLVKQSSGLRSDDEAFKKAFTDAITNALKHIGASADIHMNLWDGSKYVGGETEQDDAPEPQKKAPTYDRNPIVKAEFDRIVKGIREAAEFGTLADLRIYWTNNCKSILAMPADWKISLDKEKDTAKAALEAKVSS